MENVLRAEKDVTIAKISPRKATHSPSTRRLAVCVRDATEGRHAPETVDAAFPLPDPTQWRARRRQGAEGADLRSASSPRAPTASGLRRSTPRRPARRGRCAPLPSRWQVAAGLDHPFPGCCPRSCRCPILKGGRDTGPPASPVRALLRLRSGRRGCRGARHGARRGDARSRSACGSIRRRPESRNARLVAELIARRDIDSRQGGGGFRPRSGSAYSPATARFRRRWPGTRQRLAALIGELEGGLFRPILDGR